MGKKIEAAAKVGRNAPCACGSGKKYKRCCLAKDEAAQAETRASAIEAAMAAAGHEHGPDCDHEH